MILYNNNNNNNEKNTFYISLDEGNNISFIKLFVMFISTGFLINYKDYVLGASMSIFLGL